MAGEGEGDGVNGSRRGRERRGEDGGVGSGGTAEKTRGRGGGEVSFVMFFDRCFVAV